MSELSYFQAAVLGVVQGLTEFLPISSSGHLAIVQGWLGLNQTSPSLLLFDVISHVGTMIAVLLVFAKPLRNYIRSLVHRRGARQSVAWRVTRLGLLGTAITGVIGLTFKKEFESAFDEPWLIGGGLIFTAILLSGTAVVARGRRGWRHVRWYHAAVVGLAQSVAILPGVSRSGATICTGLFCGLRRRWAAEFSFLIAVPAIMGATLIKLKDSLELVDEGVVLPWGAIAFGGSVSGVVGFFALLALLHILKLSKLHYFAPYCVVMGMLVLAGIL